MDQCSQCIHDSITGCVMFDCIHHPSSEKYSTVMMTNTFQDRFLDEKENPFKQEVKPKW